MHALGRAMQAVQAVQAMQVIEHDNDEDAVQGSLILKRPHFVSHYRLVHFLTFLYQIFLFHVLTSYHIFAHFALCLSATLYKITWSKCFI